MFTFDLYTRRSHVVTHCAFQAPCMIPMNIQVPLHKPGPYHSALATLQPKHMMFHNGSCPPFDGENIYTKGWHGVLRPFPLPAFMWVPGWSSTLSLSVLLTCSLNHESHVDWYISTALTRFSSAVERRNNITMAATTINKTNSKIISSRWASMSMTQWQLR